MKTCSRCFTNKELIEFRIKLNRPYCYCKKCEKELRKEYHINNKEARCKKQKEYYKSNKTTLKNKRKESYKNNLEKERKLARERARQAAQSASCSQKKLRAAKQKARKKEFLNKTGQSYMSQYHKNRAQNDLHYKLEVQLRRETKEKYRTSKQEVDHIKPLALAKNIKELYDLSLASNIQLLSKQEHKEKTKKDLEKIKKHRDNLELLCKMWKPS